MQRDDSASAEQQSPPEILEVAIPQQSAILLTLGALFAAFERLQRASERYRMSDPETSREN